LPGSAYRTNPARIEFFLGLKKVRRRNERPTTKNRPILDNFGPTAPPSPRIAEQTVLQGHGTAIDETGSSVKIVTIEWIGFRRSLLF
jgi:hypothetical protein